MPAPFPFFKAGKGIEEYLQKGRWATLYPRCSGWLRRRLTGRFCGLLDIFHRVSAKGDLIWVMLLPWHGEVFFNGRSSGS
jgi:hypothetical protein